MKNGGEKYIDFEALVVYYSDVYSRSTIHYSSLTSALTEQITSQAVYAGGTSV